MLAAASRPVNQMFSQPQTSPEARNTQNEAQKPSSNGSTNSNASEYTLPLQTRQLHAPRLPLYRPAVLRAPDPSISRPTASSPVSASASIYSSNSDEDSTAYKRRDSDPSGANYWAIEEEYGKVTGPPRRDHWKPDSSASSCDHVHCTKPFSLFERRHHCRRCGKLYCGQHSSHQLRLDQEAGFHPFGTMVRGCDSCFQDYRAWKAAIRNGSTSSSGESSIVIGSPITPRVSWGQESPVEAKKPGAMASAFPEGQKVGSLVGSVPRDWNWSTF